MADISKIQTNGTTYDIKDAEARDDIASLNEDLANIDIFSAAPILPEGTDLDDVTTAGKYQADASTYTNGPESRTSGCCLFVIAVRGENTIMQVWIGALSSLPIYIRYRTSGVWYNWIQVV